MGLLGDQYVITLKLMDAQSVKIVERETLSIEQNENVLSKTVPIIVKKIMGIKVDEKEQAVLMPVPVPKVEPPKKQEPPKVENPPVVAAAPPIEKPAAPDPLKLQMEPEPDQKPVDRLGPSQAVTHDVSTYGLGYKVAGYITLALGVAAVGTGVVNYIRADQTYNDINSGKYNNQQKGSRIDDGELYDKLGVGSMIGGGALVTTGIVLLIMGYTSRGVSVAYDHGPLVHVGGTFK